MCMDYMYFGGDLFLFIYNILHTYHTFTLYSPLKTYAFIWPICPVLFYPASCFSAQQWRRRRSLPPGQLNIRRHRQHQGRRVIPQQVHRQNPRRHRLLLRRICLVQCHRPLRPTIQQWLQLTEMYLSSE